MQPETMSSCDDKMESHQWGHISHHHFHASEIQRIYLLTMTSPGFSRTNSNESRMTSRINFPLIDRFNFCRLFYFFIAIAFALRCAKHLITNSNAHHMAGTFGPRRPSSTSRHLIESFPGKWSVSQASDNFVPETHERTRTWASWHCSKLNWIKNGERCVIKKCIKKANVHSAPANLCARHLLR